MFAVFILLKRWFWKDRDKTKPPRKYTELNKPGRIWFSADVKMWHCQNFFVSDLLPFPFLYSFPLFPGFK